MLNPMRDEIEGKYRGGERKTPVTTACPEAGRSLRVKLKPLIYLQWDPKGAPASVGLRKQLS